MLRRLAVVVALCCSGVADAAALHPHRVLAASNVATFDPNIFGPGPAVDVYHLIVENPNAFPATSLALNLTGPFVNLGAPAVSFRNSAELPALGPNKVAESFFVIPTDKTIAQVLAVNTQDSNGVLSTSFTIQGGANLIPAGGSSVVAVLSIPVGSSLPSRFSWSGEAVVNGVLQRIEFRGPEPTSCVLAGLALMGAAVTRHA
jgi:hypothetical protein